MAIDVKILSRVEKLLKLAAPTSGTTEAERTSAALEAAKMIAAHNLVVREREAARPKRPIPRQPRRSQPTPQWMMRPPDPASGWVRSTAMTNGICVDPDCGEPIIRGDDVYMKLQGFSVVYVHAGGTGPCGW